MSDKDFVPVSRFIAKSYNIQSADEQKKTMLGRAVRWLRAPNEVDSVKGVRKAMAIFAAVALSITGVGIIPVVLAARTWKQQVKADKELQEVLQSQGLIGNADLELDKLGDCKFTSVEEKDVLALQEKVVAANPKYGKLSLEGLKKEGILPTKKIQLGVVNIYCSDLIKIDKKHNGVIGLVEVKGKVFPRLFYHSNSQGTWRVSPNAEKKSQGEMLLGNVPIKDIPTVPGKHVTRYGKGKCETDTQLPIALTLALNRLPYEKAKETKMFNPADVIETTNLDQPLFAIDLEKSMFLPQGAEKNFHRMGLFVRNPPDPTSIQMPENKLLHPDFSKTVSEFKQTIPHYGEVTVKLFGSKDKRMLYMFYETNDGRAFLSSVECIKGVGINTFGVREKIIKINNMDAPLLEYRDQIPEGYDPENYDENTYESNDYKNNWNYVRELEIMKLQRFPLRNF